MMKLRWIPRFLAATLALALLAPAVHAEPEGPHIAVSPYLGMALWSDEAGAEDDLVFGGRLALMLNHYIGVEGSYGTSFTETDFDPVLDVQAQHLGADVIFNLLPGRPVVPYVVGGWSLLYFDVDTPGGKQGFNGWEYGGGLKLLVKKTDRTRIDLRLDARDVMAKLDPPAPAMNDYTHNILVTAGLNMGFGRSSADTDGDGVPDRVDECPGTPMGAIVDGKGCPTDSDGDGVYDGIDRCDATPYGAVVGEFGCPRDADGDGVFNGIDRCPGTPRGATVDEEGCPSDADGDGVYDGIDTCARTPQGAVVNTSGCPKDSDGDGVFDGIDRCAGTPAGVKVDPRGCPVATTEQEAELLDTGKLRLEGVYFESAKATLKSESSTALDAVGAILLKWPSLRIEVGGHTDSYGAAALNQSLSQERAQSVIDYLTAKFPGIRIGQFTAMGYGETKPVADNGTEEGRARNRRVEFKVLNQGTLRQK